MRDNTIHERTLKRQLIKADFAADSLLLNSIYRANVIKLAVEVGDKGFSAPPMSQSLLRGKKVYQLRRLADVLVVRHITANIKRITSVKQSNRRVIVECIKTLASDGGAFRVYKFDVKSFYESVSIPDIMERLRADVAFSGQSRRVLDTLFTELSGQGVVGLPRGLALSATLAEYVMRSFDRKIAGCEGVWYYSRYVDDILVIHKPGLSAEALKAFAEGALPPGLTFNEKSRAYEFRACEKGGKDVQENSFEFLGYLFKVNKSVRASAGNKISRAVNVDIAPSKVRRMKTRIAKSLVQYRKDRNFNDLHDRLKFLTSNFTFIDKKTGQKRVSGIYYNYPLVDFDTSSALEEMDRFRRSMLLSTHPRNVLRPVMSCSQINVLMRLSFRDGFSSKRFFHFSGKRISELKRCWNYA